MIMNKKSALGAGAILAVIVAGGLYMRSHKTEPAYTWDIVESAPDAQGLPRTTVGIKVNNGVSQVVGTYLGSCHELAAGEVGVLSEKADANEISRVQCWFAGSGDEIGLFKGDDKTLVKVGELGEGTADEPAFRGNFKTVLTL